MKNYRKAKPGETQCQDCENVRGPTRKGERWRCYFSALLVVGKVVGKRMTCDNAVRWREE